MNSMKFKSKTLKNERDLLVKKNRLSGVSCSLFVSSYETNVPLSDQNNST